MAQWHWYCPGHGQVDRHVQVRRGKGHSQGRCRLCGATATWSQAPPPVRPTKTPAAQLSLFGDQQ
jgi:hypothetical protein